ncbi:hypothetical protein [Plesiomonas shigelloides]|uniref:hypothetical protein n=1 Tax=Plesiomonas shigelloides TaxID=703 RepID=UPI00326155F4
MSESIRAELIRAGIITPALERKDIIPKVKTDSISSPDSKKGRARKRRKTITKAIENSPPKSTHRYRCAIDSEADNLVLKIKKQKSNIFVKKSSLSKVDRAVSMATKQTKINSKYTIPPEKIILFVRRGFTVKGDVHCETCGCTSGILTKYSDTNIGPVILCTVCKIKAFETSFGHADAMPLKVNHAHAKRVK